MTNFQQVLSYLIRQNPALPVPMTQRVNHYQEAILRSHVPTYWTVAGLRAARLDKVEVSPVSGRTVGYYSIVCHDPITRVRHRYSWRYRVHAGVATEEKAFPVKLG